MVSPWFPHGFPMVSPLNTEQLAAGGACHEGLTGKAQGSTGENGWRVIPANYPLVIYWLVVWNGLKHGFYDFPFMLGME